jgi:hypothetical protein
MGLSPTGPFPEPLCDHERMVGRPVEPLQGLFLRTVCAPFFTGPEAYWLEPAAAVVRKDSAAVELWG